MIGLSYGSEAYGYVDVNCVKQRQSEVDGESTKTLGESWLGSPNRGLFWTGVPM